jgi:hypothetical protein
MRRMRRMKGGIQSEHRGAARLIMTTKMTIVTARLGMGREEEMVMAMKIGTVMTMVLSKEYG